ncbi:cyclic nucleotide-gated cation channel beta-1 [Plakobranchus ocellatus]|uniref:Cyclic nucleotide-gated cation channel beta-1 n=1 Tax=Plakobranchus ocellatus TaxID=259542 RepID=A0AAV4DR12_9GAST|nr:cyclic nucleotide-gated cation channel beta-1 [Plakobranchus ocellatus]
MSSGGTTSLSNVSGSLSERMHELVRAFSSRTQRAKKKISQPPTPSSDSDYDAQSGVSAADDPPPGPRTIRSFLPSDSRASDAFSHENRDHFVGVWHCKVKMPRWLKRLRFPATIEPHSKIYVSWLFLVTLAFMYNAIVIPLRGVFPYQTEHNVRYWMCADYFCDVIYLLDIILFKSRLRFINNGVGECDTKEVRKNYTKKLTFKLDLLSLTPLDLFYLLEGVGINVWLRLPRVLKIQSYWEFYERCDQASRSFGHAIRIIKTMTYMLFLIHIETCGYYAVSTYQGIASNRWVYQGKGIAYIRCFYLATKTATSIGNNPKPTNTLEYIFMTIYWLSGVFVFALLIGQIRDIVEAAGNVKDNYRKKMDSCLWYMQSINLPEEMKDKVREWFLYNWEQQKTIDERSLVSSLPRKLQTDLAINVHFNTLSKVQLFQDCERNLLYDLVLKLRPILYLPGDYVCKKGEVGKEMYIVTQGQVEVVGGENNQTVLATLHEGSVFGEISLLAMSGRGNRRTADVRCKGYTNVFTLSKHDFEMAMTEYPDAQALLKKRAKRLLRANARMEKKHKKVEAEEIIRTPPETPRMLQTVIQVMDPDSNLVKHLTPGIRRSQRVLRRPHSRSHSHRLSPSATQMHHLSPHRSHSFRQAGTSKTSSLAQGDPETGGHVDGAAPGGNSSQTQITEQTGYCTDDEAEEPVFDDTSDDVSLSEVLHDAGASSSFDDDNDEDNTKDGVNNDEEEEELLIIKHMANEEDDEVDDSSRQEIIVAQREETGGRSSEGSAVDKVAAESCDSPRDPPGPVDPRSEGYNKVDVEMTSEDSQDSGLPDAQRSDSRGKEDIKAEDTIESPPLPPRPGPHMMNALHARPRPPSLGRHSRGSGNGEINLSKKEPLIPLDGLPSKKQSPPPLQQVDSLENYTERQTMVTPLLPGLNLTKRVVVQSASGDSKEGKTRVLSVPATSGASPQPDVHSKPAASSNTRVQKLAPPSLVLVASSSATSPPCTSPLSAPPTSTSAGAGRVRKLSVVTPPVSPAPSNDSSFKHAGKISVSAPAPASTSVAHRANIVSVNGSPKGDSFTKTEQVITPVETIPIRALPSINASAIGGHAVGVGLGAGLGDASLAEAGGRGGSGGSGCGSSRGGVKIMQPVSTGLPNGLEPRKSGSPLSKEGLNKDSRNEIPKVKIANAKYGGKGEDIPAQNRVTCAVEIHRQRSVTPAGSARGGGGTQGGHKETML